MLDMSRGGFLGGGVVGGTVNGNLVVTGTLAVTGTSTQAAINASGLVAAAGAVTVGTTLDVTGASTLTGNIAAGNVNMASGKVLKLDAGTLAAPSLIFTGSDVGTGLSAATADQIIQGRIGVSHYQSASGQITLGVGLTTASNQTTHNGPFLVVGGERPAPTTVKTADYTVTSNDMEIHMAVVAGGTATLPASPGANQKIRIINKSVNSCTVGRGGKTIDGASADLTLLTLTSISLQYHNSAGEWKVLGRAAAV